MENRNRYLRSPDLLPIAHSDRQISTAGFAVMWIGMAIVLAAFALGGAGVQEMPLIWVLVASFVGCVLIGIFICITADIGIEHGISFPVYLRAPFGTIGTHFPAIIRGVTASIWFGINTYFGATAINGILGIISDFDNWFLCFILFLTVQIINTVIGIKAVERFSHIASPTIILISFWMYFSLSEEAAAAGKNVWTWVESPVTGGLLLTAFLIVLTGNMGYWSTLAADISSISRFIKAPKYERNWFKRNKGVWVGTLIAMPLVQTFVVAIGGVAYIAVGNHDPVYALQQTAGGFILAVLLVMIIFAQWSTNMGANVVPAATIFSNVGGPKVPFYVGAILAGVIGFVSQPWKLFETLLPFLGVSGGLLSAIVGIIVVDYYFIRKRRMNVPELYEFEGQYHYVGGINWAGIIAWAIGGIASIVFVVMSFFAGFIAAGIAYYVLAKYWWFKKYKQAEIENPSDELYLGITVGRDWQISLDSSKDEKEVV